MAARYVTQLVAEKHRTRFSTRHSLLEYNPQLATERILEEDEKVVEVGFHRHPMHRPLRKFTLALLGCQSVGRSKERVAFFRARR